MSSSLTSSGATMRAMVYGGHCVEEVQRPFPSLTKHHVLVKVSAVGLNPVDAKHVLGDKLPYSWTRTRSFVESHFVQGSILGFDFSGTVVASHDDMYKIGDAVFGTMPPLQGSCAEFICPPVDQICKKPAVLSHEEAAALPLVGLTALQALQPYSKSANDASILVIGASGGTGHVAISVAKALGFRDIVGVCSTRNVDFVKERGATRVLDYTSGNVKDMVSEYCNHQQDANFHVIFDCVTSADPRDAQYNYPSELLQYCSHRYIRLGGKSLDWLRAGWERTIPFAPSCFGKESLFWIRFPKTSSELQQLAEWTTQGKVKPCVSRVLDFTASQVQEAFDMFNARRVQGKLVIRVGSKTSEETLLKD